MGTTLTNEIGMVPAQLVVQFLRVRLVDGGPEAATPRDYRLDVLGSRRPGGYGGVAAQVPGRRARTATDVHFHFICVVRFEPFMEIVIYERAQ